MNESATIRTAKSEFVDYVTVTQDGKASTAHRSIFGGITVVTTVAAITERGAVIREVDNGRVSFSVFRSRDKFSTMARTRHDALVAIGAAERKPGLRRA